MVIYTQIIPYVYIPYVMRTFLFILAVVLASTVLEAQSPHWRPCNGPFGARVRYFGSWSGGFLAYTNNGGVWQTTNNGEDWKEIFTEFKEQINNVIGIDNFTIVTTDSMSVISSDNGSTWQEFAGVYAPYNRISAITKVGSVYYAMGADAGVYTSTDNCKTWKGIGIGIASQIINGQQKFYNMYPLVLDSVLYIATGYGIFTFDNTKERWKLKWRFDVNDETVVATGATYDHGTFFVSTKNGLYMFEDIVNKTWNKKLLSNINITGLIRNTDKIVATTTGNDKFYLSYSYGLQWDTVATTFPTSKQFAFGYNNNQLMYNGDASKHIYASTTSGNSWNQLPDKIRNPQQFTMLTTPTGILYEENYVNYYSNDNGETWDELKFDGWKGITLSGNYMLKNNLMYVPLYNKDSIFNVFNIEQRKLEPSIPKCIQQDIENDTSHQNLPYGSFAKNNAQYTFDQDNLMMYGGSGIFRYDKSVWTEISKENWKLQMPDSILNIPFSLLSNANYLLRVTTINKMRELWYNGKLFAIQTLSTKYLYQVSGDNGLSWGNLPIHDTSTPNTIFAFQNSFFIIVNELNKYVVVKYTPTTQKISIFPLPESLTSYKRLITDNKRLYFLVKDRIISTSEDCNDLRDLTGDLPKSANVQYFQPTIGIVNNTLYAAVAGRGIYYTITDLLNVENNITTGDGLLLYPNPAHQTITLHGERLKAVSIYSVFGEKVYENNELTSTGYNSIIPVEHLANGTYYAIVNVGGNVKNLSFVVMH